MPLPLPLSFTSSSHPLTLSHVNFKLSTFFLLENSRPPQRRLFHPLPYGHHPRRHAYLDPCLCMPCMWKLLACDPWRILGSLRGARRVSKQTPQGTTFLLHVNHPRDHVASKIMAIKI
ncbi:hypothetical protein RJT34_16028 [Clitoria ternatea]|uniref:Uncharacterized protein n=1 Tax=Clitoria ternatea TaxID=43366 RepID=A0AAN9PCJ0_CLITE